MPIYLCGPVLCGLGHLRYKEDRSWISFYSEFESKPLCVCVCVGGELLLSARRSSQGSVKNEQKPGAEFDKGSAGELQDAVVSCRKLFSCLDDGCDRLL